MSASDTLVADCDTCCIPGAADPIHYDLLLVQDHFVLVWPCPFCGNGHRQLRKGEAAQALDAGVRTGAEVRSRIARTHGPRL